MKLGIRRHLAGVSLSNTVRKLDILGVKRSPKAVHDWVHKCELQPTDGASPNHVALDETVIRIDDQQYWLYAVINPETNHLLHVQLFSTTTTALTEIFLRELTEKHDVADTSFLVDEPLISRQPFAVAGSDFDMRNRDIGTPPNVSFER